MANLIASNIFKQLIYYPESSLGVQQADTAGTLTATVTGSTGTLGEDELTITHSGSATIPVGTKVTAGTNVYYTTTAISGSTSPTTVYLDRPLVANVSTAVTLNYDAKTYVPKTLRRVSSNLDLKKETYSSNEIRSDQQIADQRTGANTVDGTISGELSSYTYNDFFGALLRRDFTTGVKFNIANATSIAVTAIAGITNSAGGGTLTWSSGDTTGKFDQIKTGDVITFSSFDAAYNNIPLLVLDKNDTTRQMLLTAATDPESFTFVIVSSATSGAVNVLGQKTWIPLTGHTKKSFTFEHYYKDISDDVANTTSYPISELFIGARPTQASIRMPSSGIATVDLTFMGIGARKPADVTKKVDGTTSISWAKTSSMLQQMTGETPLNSGIDSIYSAAVGSIYIRDKKTGGTVSKVGLITSLDLTINGNGSTLKVIGSTTSPDVALGKIQVSGNMSIYFTDAKFRDMFLNEDEASIIAVFTENAGNSINNSFMSFVMPRIKTGGATKDDAESIVMTVPFNALVGDGSNGFEATTLQLQDYSQLA